MKQKKTLKQDGIWLPQSLNERVKNLSAVQKLIYAKIESAHGQFKEVTFTNGYFAWLLNISERQVQRHLKRLEKLGYIEKRIDYPKGKQTRYLHPVTNDTPPMTQVTPIITQSVTTQVTPPYINKSINKENIESVTLPDSLIKEMEKMYPNKDIKQVAKKLEAHYTNQTPEYLKSKFPEWCQREWEKPNSDWKQKAGEWANG